MKEKLKTTTPRKTGGVKQKPRVSLGELPREAVEILFSREPGNELRYYGYYMSIEEKAIIDAELLRIIQDAGDAVESVAADSVELVSGDPVSTFETADAVRAIEKAFAYFEKYLAFFTWRRYKRYELFFTPADKLTFAPSPRERQNKNKKTEVKKNVKKK
jgi:hypothetical protein